MVLTKLGVGLGGREVDMARPGGDRSCQEILCRAWDSNQNSQPAFGQIFQDRVALLRALHQRSDIFKVLHIVNTMQCLIVPVSVNFLIFSCVTDVQEWSRRALAWSAECATAR